MKKIVFVFGTRPEIIKLYSLIKYCINEGIEFKTVYTNQHYDKEMSGIFFDELNLPAPDYSISYGNVSSHGEQIGLIKKELYTILKDEKPSFIFVHGDTNTTLAGALVSEILNIKIGHIESGLRSYDIEMPEEKNRIIVDHLSSYLFLPTELQRDILIKEGIEENKIFVTGNTICDVVNDFSNIELDILSNLGVKKQEYILLTMHRPSNVDHYRHFSNILDKISKINYTVIWPIHPRARNKLNEFKLTIPKNIKLIPPVGFKELIFLEKNAKCIMTDSGGIQEEACILKVPCITLRKNTERPETVKIGANILYTDNLSKDVENQIVIDRNWINPFGTGNIAKKIFSNIKF